jgi:hypothetical protein
MKSKRTKRTATPPMAESTPPKKAGAPQSSTPQTIVRNITKPIPIPRDTLKQMFLYLIRDERPECDMTLSDTTAFLRVKQIEAPPIIAWLNEHGAHCDCEVRLNVMRWFRQDFSNVPELENFIEPIETLVEQRRQELLASPHNEDCSCIDCLRRGEPLEFHHVIS